MLPSDPDSTALPASERNLSALSPETADYLRRLLRQNLDQLQSKVPSGEEWANFFDPVNAILEQLQAEVPLHRSNLADLKHLVSMHQALSAQGVRHRKQLLELEHQLFEYLGLQLHTKHQGTILVVDDKPGNLNLLLYALANAGYTVHSVTSSKTVFSVITELQPDLILVDVILPQVDGYALCQQLKAEPTTQNIPVIFISALDSVVDKVKAFELGAADYITKPFHIAEVLARIEHQLQIRQLQKRLEEQNVRLQQEIRDRQSALYERQQAEDRYRSIVENAVDGIFQITPAGRFLSANPALARLYGYESPQELMEQIHDVGRQLYVQTHRRAEFIAYMERFGTVSDFESQVYCKDGSTTWISENVRCVRDSDGKLLYYEGTAKDISERKQTEQELWQERRRAEHLLLNILPQKIAERLKRGPTTIAENFAEVTVLFADIVNFTPLCARVSPTELITLLNQIFSEFDRLVEQLGLEKIKTIGDAYMAVGGLPKPRPDHAQAIAELALAMQEAILKFKQDSGETFQLRIGINTGAVVAGVIGRRKFSYDLWGDTVNIASRMESEGVAGKIQVTASTYELLKDCYKLEHRGKIGIKGRGDMMTYWLLGLREDSQKQNE